MFRFNSFIKGYGCVCACMCGYVCVWFFFLQIQVLLAKGNYYCTSLQLSIAKSALQLVWIIYWMYYTIATNITTNCCYNFTMYCACFNDTKFLKIQIQIAQYCFTRNLSLQYFLNNVHPIAWFPGRSVSGIQCDGHMV